MNKPKLALDIDGTALKTPYIPFDYEENYKEYLKYYDTAEGLDYLCEVYNVYLISARKFKNAYPISLINMSTVPMHSFVGLLTNVKPTDKELVAKSLGCIGLVDNDYKVPHTPYTILVDSPYLQENLDKVKYSKPLVVSGLDDPRLIKMLEIRCHNTDTIQ